ncbi:hypothetical protein Tco_0839421 [Tanacetum coccineum]|uniref:Uncharacterized protein n=1 Tax=Tanacetum coccineum TaxID=301880 RepID=A0ABQ5AVL0_9ASTR
MYKRGPCGKTKRGIILSTSRSWEVREESDGLVIMDDGIVNWEEHTKLRDKSCTMAISQGSIGTSFVHSVDFESEISKVPQEVYVSKPIITNEKGVSAPKSKEILGPLVTYQDINTILSKDHSGTNLILELKMLKVQGRPKPVKPGAHDRNNMDFQVYALTTNPTIYGDSLSQKFWQTATANTLAYGTLELHVTIDTIVYTITKASIRNNLQLADASGITMGFRGAPRPLLPAMLLVATTNPSAGQKHPAVAQSQPSSSTIPVPSISSPPVQSPTSIHAPISASITTPTPIPETDTEPMKHTFEEPSPAHQHFSPPQELAQGQLIVDDLLYLVPQLVI